jgi:DNA repair exonuclease SbcCD ATPase subunit
MKILMLSDTQIENYPSNDELDDNGKSRRFKHSIDTIEAVLNEGWSLGCRVLYHGGDLAEKQHLKNSESRAIGDMFGGWIRNGGTIYAINGNHDGKNLGLHGTTFGVFDAMAPNSFHLATDVAVWAELGFVALPYIYGIDSASIAEKLKAAWKVLHSGIRVSPYPTLVAHYGYAGAESGSGNILRGGDFLSMETLFPGDVAWKHVFLGHVHRAQKKVIETDSGTSVIQIIGSPLINDHGEAGDKKIAAVYDTEKGTYEIIPIPQPFKWRTVDLGKENSSDIALASAYQDEPWDDETILKFRGTYTGALRPRDAFRVGLKDGLWVKPFGMPDFREFRPHLVDGGAVIDTGSHLGHKDRLAEYIRENFKGNPLSGDILERALACLPEERATFLLGAFRVTRIRAKDMLTFSDLDLEIHPEPLRIWGRNGIGKTNFMDLFVIALSGESLKNLSRSEMVRDGKPMGWVELTLSDGIRELTIRRTISPDPKKRTQSSQEISIFKRLSPTSEPLCEKAGSNAKAVELIEEWTGVSYDSMRSLNMLFQGVYSGKSLALAPAKEREKIFLELLGFSVFQEAKDRCDKGRSPAVSTCNAAKAVADNLTASWDGKTLQEARNGLGTSQARAVAARTQLDASKAGSEKTKVELLTRKNGILDWRTKLEIIVAKEAEESSATQALAILESVQVTRASERRKTIDGLIVQLDSFSPALDSDLNNLRQLFDRKEVELQILESTLASAQAAIVESKAEWRRAYDAKHKLGADIAAMKSGVVAVCPSCGRPMDTSAAQARLLELQNQMPERDAALNATTGIDDECVKKLDAAKESRDAGSKSLAILNADGMALKAKIESRDGLKKQREVAEAALASAASTDLEEIKNARKRLENAKASLAQGESRLGIQNTISGLEKEIQTWESILESESKAEILASTALATAVAECEGLVTRIHDLEATEMRMTKAMSEYGIAGKELSIWDGVSAVLDPISGLPAVIVRSYRAQIESEVNRWISALGKPDLRLILSKEDGAGLELFVDQEGVVDPHPIGRYSGGQMMRMNLALKMAFLGIAGSIRPAWFALMLLDEPDTGIDDKTSLGAALYQFSKEFGVPTIIISHDQGIADIFEENIDMEDLVECPQ